MIDRIVFALFVTAWSLFVGSLCCVLVYSLFTLYTGGM